MRDYVSSVPDLRSFIPVLVPVALWALVFLALGAGSPSEIWDPAGPQSFFDGVRSILPFVVAGPAAVFIVYRMLQGQMRGGRFIGPLGVASVYGLIGFFAAFKSPDGTVAIWWTGLYLSVPIALWGIVWRPDPLEQLRPLVKATWLAVMLAAAVLLAIAVFKLDLVDRIQDPSLLMKCRAADWLDLTSGRIRGTGVGRYAAITALLAISGMWMPKWRRIWSVLLVISLVFLLYTAARGSFVGFGAGAALIIVIYTVSAGKRAMVTALVVTAIALPVLWGTGLANEFLENCFFRSTKSVPAQPTSTPTVSVPGGVPETSLAGSSGGSSGVIQPGESSGTDGVTGDPANPSDFTTFESMVSIPEVDLVPVEFYTFSGRRAVWSDGWGLFTESPVLGYGFQADRLLLHTHMHNSIMHAMLQTGLLGTIPFILSIVFAWLLLLKLIVRLRSLQAPDKHLVIQCAGILAFFTMRSFPESTGAFFGVDWLIIAVMLFYLHVVSSRLDSPGYRPA